MGIQGLSIAVGATAIGAVTGGTSTTFTDDAQPMSDGIHTIDATEMNYFSRPSITYRNRHPKVVGDVVQKAKRVAQMAIPYTKADGSLTQKVVRVEVELDPEVPEADIDSLLLCGAQLCSSSDTASFWKTGSMA